VPTARAKSQPAARARPARKLRLVMVSHMDPRLSNGGAEIAAFQLYDQLLSTGDIEGWFLSAAPNKLERRDGVVFAQPFNARSYIYAGGRFDHFLHANMDAPFFEHARKLLGEIMPDIVHFHHYTNFGVELLGIVQEVAPKAKIVLTLHEFLAICHHYGQMVKRDSLALCERSGPRECATCFPDQSPQNFFLRKAYIMRHFRHVDRFIAPSEFLAERYIEWGLDRSRLSVIENGSPHIAPRMAVSSGPCNRPLRVGFFGQISKLKGMNVMLDAATILAESRAPVQFDIHGDHGSQPQEFQIEFLERMKAKPENVQFFGPYGNKCVGKLMGTVDAVVVPSIWWENSPLVIQEALAHGCPVICSDIGGMKEKVRPGLDGFHFQAGSAFALAELLTRLAEDRTRLGLVRTVIRKPPTIAETASITERLYKALRQPVALQRSALQEA
jgi:glycosyltransferase involved in cell wall biosynthesis